ncbi:MAG TPA: Ig-like domain-containing protein, partial [Burkholderiaceae bacterium]|nr:Ig-like domain-containing protein [Burkholderiaceae bacterium]
MKIRAAGRLVAAFALSFCATVVAAAGVSVKFNLASPDGSPFPSDRFTVPDFTQRTFRRVKLPKPDCTVQVSDCADIDVINTLDGFNTQPRITVPFTGDIDVNSVNSDTVFLVNLGDTLTARGFGDRVGINQILWDPATKTLVFESDELLAEHSRYLLVVTNGVRDAAGHPIERGSFGRFHHDLNFGQSRDADERDYRKSLLDGQHSARAPRERIVALSLFTTRTTTGTLETIRKQIKASHPAPVNFMIGNGGSTRAVFPLSSVAGIQFVRQVKVGTGASSFDISFLPTPALNVVPGSVASVAFG